MIYPEANLQEWISKYQLEVEEKKCLNCGQYFRTTIPIIIRGYAGLETPEHECGTNHKAAVFVPISEDKLNLWKEVI